MLRPYCSLLVVSASLLFILGARAALAQDVSVPPEYCKKSTLTGSKFLNLLEATVKHRDLTDITFLERNFGTKLIRQNDLWPEEKSQANSYIFQSNSIFGNPIRILLYRYSRSAGKSTSNYETDLSFEDRFATDYAAHFIEDCLHITGAEFLSRFKEGFQPTYRPAGAPLLPGMPVPNNASGSWKLLIDGYIQNRESSNTNSSQIYLSFYFITLLNGRPGDILEGISMRQER